MGIWVVETEESKEAVADMRTGRVSSRAVQREEWVVGEGGAEDEAPFGYRKTGWRETSRLETLATRGLDMQREIVLRQRKPALIGG